MENVIPFLHVGQEIDHVDDTVWLGPDRSWGDSATVRVRLVMRDLDPSISPDYWVEIIELNCGREYEVRASYLAEYVS